MSIDTYATLQTAVDNWLARTDLSGRSPEFIALCEAKLNRDLRCTQMERRSYTTVNLSSNEPEFISLPTDFQTMRRVRLSSVTGKPRLQFKSGVQADEYRYATDNTSAQPVYFTVFGDEMELIPTPILAHTIEMVYRSNIPALASNSTNWLLTLAPDIYLYGALMEAAAFIKEDSRIATWAQGFSNALDGLNRLAQEQSNGAGPLEVRVSGVSVQ